MPKPLKPINSWLAYDPADVLRTKCTDVSVPLSLEHQELVAKMMAYIDASYEELEDIYNIKPGIAIAAPQLKVPVKIIYIHFDEQVKDQVIEHRYLLANPKILGESAQHSYLEKGEGCLSVREPYSGLVFRKRKVVIKAYDLLNHQDVELTFEGLLSICFQHELDHLNGILYYDRIDKKQPFKIWENAVAI